MPGESFTAQPNIDIHKGNCACVTADYQYWKYITTVQFMNADLYLGYVNIPNYSAHEPRYVSDGYLTTSTPDLSKLEPITKYYDNAIKIAYENKLLEIDPSAYGEEEYSNLQSALEAACELPGHTFNAGYVNNTGLPMLLRACYAGGKKPKGEEVGTEGCGHVGHGPVRSMYGGGFSEFYVTFYEPYYNINYEGVENYFTEEELADLPDRYYIQREEQQIVLPNPVRPGYHFKNWRESGYDIIIGYGETITVKDGKTIITFDFENGLRYGAGDKNLAPIFTSGCTVTFNPNGGALKDGEKAIREIDLKSVENGQFFDIGGVIPVREGYTFAGWSFSPSGERNSIIANTANSDWFADWESYYRSLQYGENPASTSIYDIQLYAVWEKNVTELTNSDTNVSISLTDGVPEDATLSADTIAQESVLESRPELKEELPGLLSIYDISVRQNGETLEIKDNPMTVKIPLNDHLKGYKYYQAVYLGDPLERFDAVVEGDFLVFETDHLSQYAILGSNTPFETSEKPTDPTDPTDPTTPTDPTDPAGPTDPTDPTDPTTPTDPTDPAGPTDPTTPTDPADPADPTDPTDPTTPTDPTDPAGPTDPTTPTDPADPADPTDPAKPEQQGKPSEQIESPQTGDSSNMALWISLMMVSCGGLLGMLFYKRKKTAAGK